MALTIHDILIKQANVGRVDIAVLDFSKAFDTVPHNRLLTKLKHYGNAGNTLTWIREFKRNARIYVGDSIVRKKDTRFRKGENVVVCLPGAIIEHVTERVEEIMGSGNGGSILVHIGTNNADNEGTTAIIEKYRNLLKKTKQARIGQILLSGILPVFGNRIQGYRNSKRMAVNGMVKRLWKEEEVGYVDLWDSFVGKEEMYMRDGLEMGQQCLPRDCQER